VKRGREREGVRMTSLCMQRERQVGNDAVGDRKKRKKEKEKKSKRDKKKKRERETWTNMSIDVCI